MPRRFAFRHPLVRRAVYASTKGGWRLAAHARAAQTLAAQGASAAARAHHVEQSGVRGERAAIELLLEAGDADAPRAPAGAARWYAAALRLMPEDDRPARLRTLMKLAQMQQSTGDLARCHATLLEAIELVPGDDLALRLRLTSACAACENFLGRHEPAERRLVAALNALPDQGSREAVAVLLDLATGAFFTLELERMCDMARRGLAAARALGEPALVGAAAAVLAHGCATAGLVAEASSNADEAGARLDDLPDDTLALYLDAVSRLAWAEYLIERFDDSIRHAARGVAVARATGQGQFAQLILSAQALSTTIRGDLSAATALQEEAIETAELAANDYLTSGVLTATANIAMATGDLERARRAAERSVACVADVEGGHLAAMARVRLAVTLRELGASAADTEELVASAGGWELPLIPPAWRVAYKEAITRVELDGGRLEQAAACAESAESDRRRARAAAGDGRGAARPRRACCSRDGQADAAAESGARLRRRGRGRRRARRGGALAPAGRHGAGGRRRPRPGRRAAARRGARARRPRRAARPRRGAPPDATARRPNRAARTVRRGRRRHRVALTARARGRDAGHRAQDEQGGRRRAVPQREDRRVAPAQHLRQARRILAGGRRARGRAQHQRPVANAPADWARQAARRQIVAGSRPARCGVLLLHDQPRAAPAREEADRPAGEDEQPVLEADQVEEVDREPREPGGEAR